MTTKQDFPAPLRLELPPRSPQAEREVRRNTPLRAARTCYDHLAGVAGIRLFGQLLDRGWIELADDVALPKPDYRLTETGAAALRERGIDTAFIENAKRRFAYGCTDWTERSHHLGGALGAAILASLVDLGYVTRQAGTRVVDVSGYPLGWLNPRNQPPGTSPALVL